MDSDTQTHGLFNVAKESMTEEESDHVLEQYKLYVEMTDRISARRQQANTYFLALNSALLALATGYVTYVGRSMMQSWWILATIAAGGILCFTWRRLIKSYSEMNSGKFQIIFELERRLPASLYTTEWAVLHYGDGTVYTPFTKTERIVPYTFGTLYALLAVLTILEMLQTQTIA